MSKNFTIKGFADTYNSLKTQNFIELPGDTIYHYTSPVAFKSIIENKTLRFTDCHYLNDYSESKYALDLCYEYMDDLFAGYSKRVKSVFEKAYKNKELDSIYPLNKYVVFQCSFSENPDSLCLWNYYTKGKGIEGYNIGFDVNNLFGLDNNGISGKLNIKRTTFIGKVIYSEEKQIEIIREIIDEFCDYLSEDNINYYNMIIHMLMDKIKAIGAFFKPKCFEIEQEARVIFNFESEGVDEIDVNTGNRKVKLDYFERNGIFVPFFDVGFKETLIKSIGCSPTLNNIENLVGINKYLKYKGINIEDENIYGSKIPVRF